MNTSDPRTELTKPPRPTFGDWAVLAISVEVVIMPMHFATNAELLCAALRNYSANREARADLVRRPALP